MFDPFVVVQVTNDVLLYYADDQGVPAGQHYAFRVGEAEFDQIRVRLLERGIQTWADPFQQVPDEIYHRYGGRGVYWKDPVGHDLEITTSPYLPGRAEVGDA